MNAEKITVIRECVRASLAAEITFAEVVRRLMAIGIERYHADYTRDEITYYSPNGDSNVEPAPHVLLPTGLEFDAAEVAAAVGRSQRGEHTYADFVRETMAAGCVGYFVCLTGQRVIYFGRSGESHTEYFPGAAK